MSVSESGFSDRNRNPGESAGSGGVSQPPTPGALSSVRAETICLVTLTFLVTSYTLYAAASLLIPIAAAVVLTLALLPIVRWMKSKRIPPSVGSAVCLTAAALLISGVALKISEPAAEWLQKTPIRFRMLQIQRRLEPVLHPLTSARSLTTEVSDAVTAVTSGESEADIPERVILQPPPLVSEMDVLDSTWQFAAGILMCVVLTYFMLAAGVNLSEQLAGHSVSRNAVESIRDVEATLSRYVLTVTTINIGLGCGVGIACRLIGLPNAVLWGAMAAVLNFLPYVGALAGTVVVLLVSLFTFEPGPWAFAAPAAYLLLTLVEGNFVTPAVLGRSMRLHPLLVLLSLTYWTWLWGIAGAVLAVPLLAVGVTVVRRLYGPLPQIHVPSSKSTSAGKTGFFASRLSTC